MFIKKKKNYYHFSLHRLNREERTLCLRPVVHHLYISHWSRVVPLPPPAEPPSFLLVTSRRGTLCTSIRFFPPSHVLSFSFSRRRSPFLFPLFFSTENVIQRPNRGPGNNVCHVLPSPPVPTHLCHAAVVLS